MGKFWFIFMIACHGIGHKPRARRLTCVTTSSKPNNDRIWEIVSEISWTEWVLIRWPFRPSIVRAKKMKKCNVSLVSIVLIKIPINIKAPSSFLGHFVIRSPNCTFLNFPNTVHLSSHELIYGVWFPRQTIRQLGGPIVLHHPQEIWSRNSISRNFSSQYKSLLFYGQKILKLFNLQTIICSRLLFGSYTIILENLSEWGKWYIYHPYIGSCWMLMSFTHGLIHLRTIKLWSPQKYLIWTPLKNLIPVSLTQTPHEANPIVPTCILFVSSRGMY